MASAMAARTPSLTESDADSDTEEQPHGHDQGQVLVTNASGFVAAHIVAKLMESGIKVRGTYDPDNGTMRDAPDFDMNGILKLKELFPKLDLCEAGFSNNSGWKRAVQGCTHVIHTSCFKYNRPATEDDTVTKLLQACQEDGGIKRVVVTGGFHSISEDELRDGKLVTLALKNVVYTAVSRKAASIIMGFNKAKVTTLTELGYWRNVSRTLKDVICKDLSEQQASRFMQTGGILFGLSIIKPAVVVGPILCEKAEANVEIVPFGTEFSFPICDVRDVAEAHIMALQDRSEVGAVGLHRGITPQQFDLKTTAGILKKAFKGEYDFPQEPSTRTVEELHNFFKKKTYEHAEHLHGGVLVGKGHTFTPENSVIDMAKSFIDLGCSY